MKTIPHVGYAGSLGLVIAIFWSLGAIEAKSETLAAAPITTQLWRPIELSFTAESDHPDPFDFEHTKFIAVFEGPENQRLEVPGFWDGGRTWRIRFTPTKIGEWSYRTSFSDGVDQGLDRKSGRLHIGAARSANAVQQHGGFLKVSENHRYLTFSDGTPFFWLGDTWWAVPSANVPFANFQRMVDRRVEQGYTLFQAHGFMPLSFEPKGGIGAFTATRTPDEETVRYWQEVDKYFSYAEEKGMIGVFGFSTAIHLDRLPLSDIHRLWRYYLARYGAYPVTFLITQEYNEKPDERVEQISRLLKLGQFIKDSDPWKRAMTAHSWVHSHEGFPAEKEPWHDFTMLQGGHSLGLYEKFYRALWERTPVKPFVQSEANYEGFINRAKFSDATVIRHTAYTAIQTGCFGFTYGAQGLYSSITDRSKPGTTAKWGPVLTWEEGLALPGGAQLAHLRKCYESLEWWKLDPVSNAIKPAADVLVKADGDKTLLLYFPPQVKVSDGAVLTGVSKGFHFRAEWFDPRTGNRIELGLGLFSSDAGLSLPQRPDDNDWLLILHRRGGR